MLNLKKEFLLPFKRIAIAHILVAVILFYNALIFTENQISMIIQIILGMLVILHHLDDNILKKSIINYIELIKEKHNYQETLTESNNNAIIAINEKREILTFNKKAETIFGFNKNEMIGKDNLHLIMPNGFFKKHDKASASFFKSKESIGILHNTHELFGKRKNNEIFPIRISFGVNAKATIVIANISDITQEQDSKNEQLRLIHEIEQTQTEVITTLGTTIESRDKNTKNHVDRVSLYSKKLAIISGISETEAEKIRLASPLHDVGKIIIPDSILNKPSALTSDEYNLIKSHAKAGYDILKNSKRELLQMASIIAYQHHEKFDGTGYPQGLKGEDIHIYGRITAIADVFDALSTSRVYKKAWSDEKVKQILQDGKGTAFDPTLLDLFLRNYNDFIKIKNSLL